MKKNLLTVLVCLLFFVTTASAAELRVASGAGYKRVIEQWAKLYEKSSGNKIERMYGNMGQVMAQVQHGGGICVVVGDKSYLTEHELAASKYTPVGVGRPVLVSRKGLKLASLEDLKKKEFARISAPDFEKAIFGKAAKQILDSFGYKDILDKTIQAGTVPRSGAYAIKGEVDAAFINMTYALANRDKFGSMLELTQGFSAIEIAAGVLDGCEGEQAVKHFIALLKTDVMAKKIAAAGL